MRTHPLTFGQDTQMGAPIDDSPHVSKDDKAPEESIRAGSRPYNDAWAAIAWMASVIVVAAFGIIGYHVEADPDTVPEPRTSVLTVRRLLLIIFTAASSSFVTSMGLVNLTQKYAREVIYASNGMLLGIYAASSVASLSSGNPAGGLIFGVIFVIHCIFLYVFRQRIPFAALCLQTSARLTQKHRGMISTAFVFAFAQIGFVLLWGSGLFDWSNPSSHEMHEAIFWPWLFFLFWSTQVFTGIVHATTCGVVAMWYFTGGAMPQNPTLGALRRACSFSLGSICLGSLIVAILKTVCALLRLLTRQGGDNHNFLRFVARALVNTVESLMEYFNAYAFVHIAIYGKPYVESAKATWQLVKSSAIQGIVNDDFTNTLSLIHVLFCTVLSGIVCGCVFHIPGEEHGWLIPGAIGAGIAFFVSQTVFQVLSSGVMALFVCYAEQPDVLRRVNPAFASAMMGAIREH